MAFIERNGNFANHSARPICPQPPEYTGEDPTIPVPLFPHFDKPQEDDLNCLNLNIVLPSQKASSPLPVMVWIHGGSFLFGSSTIPIYDMVNFVTYAAERGTPIIGVSINYRVGLFGFLASQSIKDDLTNDGFAGAGNFGLTDQQTALEWVHRHIASVGGDPANVTIFGESAGGMSVAHQVWASTPAPFHRAVSMSGTLNTIPAWPLEQHERRFRALLRHLRIDAAGEDDALQQLRRAPHAAVAAATCAIEGSVGATANPCDDGWYHAARPSPARIRSPPGWLRGYMIGDVRDEAMIFRGAMDDQDYASICAKLARFLGAEHAEVLLGMYGITPDVAHEQLEQRFEVMASDGVFKVHTYLHARASRVPRTYAYHIDQVSTLDNWLKGLAYHAIDLLYVFMNLEEGMSEGQRRLSRKMAGDFVDFAYGKDPWRRFDGGNWMVYGPDDGWAVKTENEDEGTRQYERMRRILDMGVFPKWMEALDYIVNKRWILGADRIATEGMD